MDFTISWENDKRRKKLMKQCKQKLNILKSQILKDILVIKIKEIKVVNVFRDCFLLGGQNISLKEKKIFSLVCRLFLGQLDSSLSSGKGKHKG